MSTLGNKISSNRKQLNMTQEDLANKLNVSAQAVSKWENDLSIPDLPILIELADMFHITLDELIRQKEDLSVPRIVPEESRKSLNDLILKIIIDDSDGDKVRVNLPMPLVKAGLALGMMPQINGHGSDTFKNIDIEALLSMVEQGMVGKLVEIDSSDGDHIEIVVE